MSTPRFASPISASRPKRSPIAARGFTLIELMVVVMIVGILAAIAIPTIGQRLRERRSSEVAQRIAQLYRQARMRSMGRGSAVMVRYNSGVFSVLEAIRLPTAANGNCVGEPSSSCLTAGGWDAGQANKTYVDLATFNIGTRSEYSDVTIARAGAGTGGTYVEVCFTPAGRAFGREAANVALTSLTTAHSFTVSRGTGSLTRTVTVLPNGMARTAL